ncbi:MAG: M23 family metallopeptidase [Bacteroidetes bacterium]|nr:M23 family metallopeptidase [Bacteroidota bacterium]
MKLIKISLLTLLVLTVLSCNKDDDLTVSSSLITIVENNAPTDGFDFPVIPGEMDGWKEPLPPVPESDPNFDPSSYLAQRSDGIHAAIDFYREDGTDAGGYELWAIGNGVVVDIVYDRVTYPDKHDGGDRDVGWGNLILIQHDYVENDVNKRIYAQYAHCQTIEVELNEPVTRGQRVGLIGGTNGMVGSNFDNHLHFELRTTNLKADAWPQSIGLSTVEAVSQHYTHPLEFIRAHRP